MAARKALVVEDHPDARALVRTYLMAMGLEVVDVAEGRSAIRVLQASRPDLVCLDLMLPELSGFEVCEFMRARPELRDVPILVMSARAKPMDRAFAEEVGATAYLVKPFKRSEFSRAVDLCMPRGTARLGILADTARAAGAALGTSLLLRLLPLLSPWLGIPLCVLVYSGVTAALGLLRRSDLIALGGMLGRRSGRSSQTSAVETGPAPLP